MLFCIFLIRRVQNQLDDEGESGSEDRVIPASYLDRFAAGMTGAATIDEIAGAGHLAELDQPDALAERVMAFLDA